MTYDDLLDGRRQQFAREDAAEQRRMQREASAAFTRVAQAPRPATIAAGGSMYTSEPIEGVQSPFYAGTRFIADAELARRERIDLSDDRPDVCCTLCLAPLTEEARCSHCGSHQ